MPPDLDQVPDAEPRVEPVRLGGPNKPYEVNGRWYTPAVADIAWLEAVGDYVAVHIAGQPAVRERLAAEAGAAFLASGDARALRLARRRFMKAHGRVFFILGIMQYFWYRNDRRRERFVSICRDPDVQALTWQAYMHKELVRARPAAHVRIFFKDLAHLFGLATP